MNGQEATEDVYDEATHAAIHRKIEDQNTASPFLQNMGKKKKEQKAVTGGRPTSGKHYARDHQFAKRKGELAPPDNDPIISSIPKNFEKSKKVESLLNKLAQYMAGEIPDSQELDELFAKDKLLSPEEGQTDLQNFDDATTV